MKKQSGFTIVEALIIVLVMSVVGFAGYFVWQNQNKEDLQEINTQQQTKPVTIDDNENDKPNNVSPVSSTEENLPFCTTASERNGDYYELYNNQKDEEIYTYSNSNIGLEFSYPTQWGGVLEDETGNPICVGPLALRVGIDGQYGQGDGDLISSSTGFIKDGSTYYYKWFYEDGPYEIKPSNYDLFKIVSTSSNDSVVIAANNCTGLGCAKEATLNLSKGNYEGFGISNRRITSEDVSALLSGPDAEYFKDSPPVSSISFDQLIAEMEKFISTISISN